MEHIFLSEKVGLNAVVDLFGAHILDKTIGPKSYLYLYPQT